MQQPRTSPAKTATLVVLLTWGANIRALLPKAGKIIYVRSYNQNYVSISDANDDDKDGNPDFDLLNKSNTEYDGSSWGQGYHW